MAAARGLIAFWSRRALALAVDLLIVEALAQAGLNLVWWPLPPWACPLAVPAVFVVYSTALASRGPQARTLGKRVAGLVIRSVDGSRPRPRQLLARSAILALLWLVDWADVFTSAEAQPKTFGTIVVVAIAVVLVLLTYSILAQIRSGGATPHDAVAGTEVVRTAPALMEAAEPRATSAVTAAIATVLAATLFVIGLAYQMQTRECPACREAESIIAQRFGALTRVTISAHQETGQPNRTARLETRVWMPFVVAPRPQQATMLKIAFAVAEQSARQHGWNVDGGIVTKKLTQMPLTASMTQDSRDSTQAFITLRAGLAGEINILHFDFGFDFKFKAVPLKPAGQS